MVFTQYVALVLDVNVNWCAAEYIFKKCKMVATMEVVRVTNKI